jgi:hypothetical protein
LTSSPFSSSIFIVGKLVTEAPIGIILLSTRFTFMNFFTSLVAWFQAFSLLAHAGQPSKKYNARTFMLLYGQVENGVYHQS